MRSLILFAAILVVSCTTVTVQTSTGQGQVSHEDDKGVVIKPSKSTTEEKK